MAHAHGLPNTWAVFLMLMAYIDGEDEHGNLYAHCSRAYIAEALSLTSKQVGNAVNKLKQAGYIAAYKRGHKGRSTVYKFSIGTYSEAVPMAIGSTLGDDPTTKGTTLGDDPIQAGEQNEHDQQPKVLPLETTLQTVGSTLGDDPERTIKNSSFSSSSFNSVTGGQFPYGIDRTKLPPKEDIMPLSEAELKSRFARRGASQ